MEGHLELVGLIAVLVALGFWLEMRFAWAARVGATMLVILFGFGVSNLRLVPFESPVYAVIGGPVTDLAIVWLLFAVNLADLKQAGRSMLILFAAAVTATAIGAGIANGVAQLVPGVPQIIWLTTVALILGQLPFHKWARKAEPRVKL